jgi:hypothetical protein
MKMGPSLNKLESGISGGSCKKLNREVSLLRNVVSFLLEMVLFVNTENGSKMCCYYLVQ